MLLLFEGAQIIYIVVVAMLWLLPGKFKLGERCDAVSAAHGRSGSCRYVMWQRWAHSTDKNVQFWFIPSNQKKEKKALYQLVRLVCMGKWELVCETCDELFIGRSESQCARHTYPFQCAACILQRLYHLKAKLRARNQRANAACGFFFLFFIKAEVTLLFVRKLKMSLRMSERKMQVQVGFSVSRLDEANDFEAIKYWLSLIANDASDEDGALTVHVITETANVL